MNFSVKDIALQVNGFKIDVDEQDPGAGFKAGVEPNCCKGSLS